MLKYKKPHQKGKVSFSRFFQKFKEGDSVAVVRDLGFPFSYSKRIQGRTGRIISPRGASYYIEIKELGKAKKYLIHPIHLKKIQLVPGSPKTK